MRTIALLPSTRRGSEAAGDDIIILGEEEETRTGDPTARLLDFWDRYAFGNVGGFYGIGTSTSRYLFAARLGFEAPFRLSDWFESPRIDMQGRVRLEMGYGTRRVEIEQELECFGQPCTRDTTAPDYRPLEREIKASSSEFELREAYGELEPISSLVVTVGRQRPIWGQFDIFSAVNLLLPIEFQSNEFGLGKQTYRMPQDVLTVSWFPMARLEVQGYYFFSTNLDPLYQDALEGDNRSTTPFYVLEDDVASNNIVEARRATYPYIVEDGCSDDGSVVNSTILCNAARADTKPEDEDGLAFRVLYYGTYATVGLTYHDGLNSFSFSSSPVISRIGSSTNPNVFNTRERIAVADSTSYGLEIAVPYGRWNWKAEFVYRDTEADLANLLSFRVNTFDDAERPAISAYYNWLVDNNGGSGSVPTTDIWFMAGFDADYDKWNFGLAFIYNDIAVSGRGKEGERLRIAAFPRSSSDSEIDATNVFGTGYVSYNFGEEEDHIVGFAGGVLGPILGATLFYNGSWRDDLDWTVALEYQQTVSDQFLSDNNEDERRGGMLTSRYQQKDDFSFGGRLGLVYRF